MEKTMKLYSTVALVLALLVFPHQAVRSQTLALKGTIVVSDDVIDDGTLLVDGDKIFDVGKDIKTPDGLTVIAIDGIILPGFIDLHNHLTWNVFPRWLPGQTFADRYEWQAIPEYERVLRIPQSRLIADGFGCKANMFAEIKAIMGGATSVAGSFVGRTASDRSCVVGLARNLDHETGLPKKSPTTPCAGTIPPMVSAIANEVFPMEIPFDRLDWYRCELEQGTLRGLLVHLSEGKPGDASGRREFRMLKAQGILREGLVIIHGTSLGIADFKEMQTSKVGLVWSPRSNNELYGGTISVAAAQAVGLAIAIGPDWSPTGSAGMLQELNYAATRYGEVVPKQLVSMATSVPAKIARVDDQIGTLQPGRLADILVLRKRGGAPYETVVSSTPADVRLVMVGGVPIYGDRDIMERLLPGKLLEDIHVCGAQKVLSLASLNSPVAASWEQLRIDLEAELKRYGSSLSSIECN
jgi:hypothetical protein